MTAVCLPPRRRAGWPQPRVCSTCEFWWPKRPTHRNPQYVGMKLTFIRKHGTVEAWTCSACGMDYLFSVSS